MIAMKRLESSRRDFLKGSLGGLAVMLPISGPEETSPDEEASAVQATVRPIKVVCLGAHPDDPESGCGGTLARYAELGHRVTIIYLTRGERGILGKSLGEAAAT